MEIKTTEQILGELNKTNPVTMEIKDFDSWLIEKEKKWCSIDDILKQLNTINDNYLKYNVSVTITALQTLIKDIEDEKIRRMNNEI